MLVVSSADRAFPLITPAISRRLTPIITNSLSLLARRYFVFSGSSLFTERARARVGKFDAIREEVETLIPLSRKRKGTYRWG